jgi:hypothetical protein
MPFLIDGHNLLHSIHKATEDFESLSEIQLCRIVTRYLTQIGERGEMIFDGTGPQDKSPFENMGDLEVAFAGLGTDADTVIEQKIRISTAPRRLTVVSSDRRLRRAAQKRKATAVRSDVFWSDVQKQLRRRTKAREPAEKRFGLSESETQQWLEFFGLEQ